ncbi:hypothetical protein BD310DRAFT_903867 [Dichomitus squalens]|uniref:Uncharacterized protein n=1 Tax=Dichomitus squalens TaxID=114155 RepID=A0A4Q9Q6S8_9APHY|nr:hypothetical protein BD310DRAFT_903867 [Dichomitus squalens]
MWLDNKRSQRITNLTLGMVVWRHHEGPQGMNRMSSSFKLASSRIASGNKLFAVSMNDWIASQSASDGELRAPESYCSRVYAPVEMNKKTLGPGAGFSVVIHCAQEGVDICWRKLEGKYSLCGISSAILISAGAALRTMLKSCWYDITNDTSRSEARTCGSTSRSISPKVASSAMAIDSSSA